MMDHTQIAKPAMQSKLGKQVYKQINRVCWLANGPDSDPQLCRLLEVSDRGAMLACDQPSQVSDKFTLLLTRDGKVARLCKVVERLERELVVQFLGNQTR